MTEAERKVKTFYPDADVCWLNRGVCFIKSSGNNKMSHGYDLSGYFKFELTAWADALRKLTVDWEGER